MYNAWVADVNGGNARRVSQDRKAEFASPVWLENGLQILVSRRGTAGFTSTFELYQYSVDGGTGVRICTDQCPLAARLESRCRGVAGVLWNRPDTEGFRHHGFVSLLMTMIAALAREDFPAASRCTYLNSASVALMSASAAKAAIDWQQDIADNGTLNFDEIAEDRVYDDLRLSFGRLVQADADSIAVGSSATELLSSLAWSIAPKQGQNIVSVDAVFPSTSYPWMRVARATGSEMRWVRAQDGVANESDIISVIDKNTAVVSISHVEYASGQRHNLEAIATAAHSHGALLIVDATQSVGAIPIDVGQESVDALVTGSYKWLCGPFGVGLMYLTPRLQESLDPGIVGWRSHKEIYDLQADRLEYVQTARRFEASTMAYGCAVGLATAIGLLERIGIERIYQHNIELADELIDAVRSDGGQIISPLEDRSRTSIVSLRIAGLDSGKVVRHLGERDIIASSRRGNVRLSLHLYNGSEDVTRVKDALRELRRA